MDHPCHSRTPIRHPWVLFLVGLSLLLSPTDAIHSPNNPLSPPNSYSLNRQISLNPTEETIEVDGETEAISFYYDNYDEEEKEGEEEDTANGYEWALSESTKSQMKIQGGEQIPFVAMAECAFGLVEDKDMDDDDDEDDDDDDDGHSSMLSNASLRKTALVSSSSFLEARPTKRQVQSTFPSSRATNRNLTPAAALPSSSSMSHSLLNIRGGASLTPTSELSKRLIVAALVTLLYEGSLGHILEFLKIAMQTAPIGTTYTSILQTITSEKGILGAWDGFIPWGVIQAIAKGGVFGIAHAAAKQHLLPLVEAGKMPLPLALTLAGGIAGGFQGYVLSPTLLLKTRVMTNPVFRDRMSVWKTTWLSFAIGIEVVKQEGVGALMKGSNVFALKRVFDWSTRYFFSDGFETLLVNMGRGVEGALSPGDKIVASLLGGTASTITTLPLDVIVAKSQDAKKAGVKVSPWDTFMKDYKEGGWKGLYDANMMGFEARLLHVCFTTVAMKTGTALLYDFLYGTKRS